MSKFLVINMVVLAEALNTFLIAVADEAINYGGFTILYNVSLSREIFLYWKFKKLDLTISVDARCLSETWFYKRDLICFASVLHFSNPR